MKKTIRLTESELISLVKRVIKEESEIMGPFDGLDMNELRNMGIDVQDLETKAEEVASKETENITSIVDDAVSKIPEVKKLNSEQLGEFNILKDDIKKTIKSTDVCTKEGKRKLLQFLKSKRNEFFEKLKKSFSTKNNKLQEQISPGVGMALALVGFILLNIIVIWIIVGGSDRHCRRMRRYVRRGY
jgi:hypothetical protein